MLFNLRKRRLFYWISFILIISIFIYWQYTNYIKANSLNKDYRITSATGLDGDTYKYVYFYYYTGYYPLATRIKNPGMSKDTAYSIIYDRGNSLYMSGRNHGRYGHDDPGEILLYLPYAYFKSTPLNPSVIPFNAFAFILALIALLFTFYYYDEPLLGIFLVVFNGANAFQLYEVYGRENVFSWPITIMLFLLAFNSAFIFDVKLSEKKYLIYIIAIISAILLALIYQIRSEPVTIIVSVFFLYLVKPLHDRILKLNTLLIFILSFISVIYISKNYFLKKFENTSRIVESSGGTGLVRQGFVYHSFWHPFFCGLGDFGGDKGYKWLDIIPYTYAKPILEKKHNIKINSWDRGWCYSWEDAEKDKCKTLEVFPEYPGIIREKLFSEIFSDPIWYLEILWSRIKKIASTVSPIQFGSLELSFAYPWLIWLTALMLVAFFKKFYLLKILLFPIPLSLPALAIYSGGGMTLYSCYHFFAAAVIIVIIFQPLLSNVFKFIRRKTLLLFIR